MRKPGIVFPLVCTIAICLCSGPFAERTHAQDRSQLPDTSQLLSALEAAIKSIRSFEVHITAKDEWLFSEKSSPNKKSELIMHTPPLVTISKSRQLFSEGKRKIEKFDIATGQVEQTLGAADFETERTLNIRTQRGNIRRAGGVAAEWGHDYQESFRTLCAGVPTIHVFRDRTTRPIVRQDGHFIIMEVAPGPGASLGNWGFTVRAELAANFLPIMTETFQMRDGKKELVARMTVLQRRKIDSGISVPTKIVTEFFSCDTTSEKYQQLNHRIELSVDENRSRWNIPIDDDAFRIPFPSGVLVTDEIRDVAFVVGKPDPGKNLEELAANSQVVARRLRSVYPETTSRVWTWWIVAGSGVLIIMILGIFLYFKRSPRATT